MGTSQSPNCVHDFLSSSPTCSETSENSTPKFEYIAFRWFSPLERLILAPEDEETLFGGSPKPDAETNEQSESPSVAEIVDSLFSENPAIRTWALQKTKRLTIDWPYRLAGEEIGVETLPKVVDGLKSDDPSRQLAAALASAIITFEHGTAAVESGCAPLLIALFSSPDPEIVSYASLAISNLAYGENPQRNYLVELGIIKSLMKYLNPNTPAAIVHELALIIVCLCDGRDRLCQESAYREMIPALQYLIQHTDTEVLIRAAWAVEAFAVCGWMQIGLIIDAGITRHLVLLLSHSNKELKVMAMHALRKMVYGTNEQKQAVLDCGLLSHLPGLLKIRWSMGPVDALGCLFDLTVGNERVVRAVIDHGLLPLICHHAFCEDISTSYIARSVICNLVTYGSDKEVQYIINSDYVRSLCLIWDDNNVERNSELLRCLSGVLYRAGDQLEKVRGHLENCGLLDKLETVCFHADDSMFCLSYHIMEDYFS
ncbi:unnamed protein product [Calicophoron daubneyi]|uniref:Uncharacterized protein n=1 Tax=Calicophoron daubneyi TaxID=300641 RepID=A0AAV2TK95_CALDB